MTMNHIHIFIKVYQLENITRAAEALRMTQPAVSRAIKELEDKYDVRLFERINRRLCRTEYAHQLYAQAVHIADSFGNMEQQLKSWGDHQVLRLGATVTFGTHLMPQLVADFKERNVGCSVQVMVANGVQLQQALVKNHIDLALIEGTVANDTLQTLPFLSDALHLIVPIGHPLTCKPQVRLEDVVCYDVLTREEGSAVRTLLDHVAQIRGLHLVPTWESMSTQALIHAVHKGLGVALLPAKMVEFYVERGLVSQVDLDESLLQRKSFLVWHKHKFLTAGLQQFIADCQDYCDAINTSDKARANSSPAAMASSGELPADPTSKSSDPVVMC